MRTIRTILAVAALYAAAPILAQAADQPATPAQPDTTQPQTGQDGKTHSGHHHHKQQGTPSDGTDTASPGH
ncbi:MAG: hypothetical protein WDN69_10590 [Aliidongia sp.]